MKRNFVQFALALVLILTVSLTAQNPTYESRLMNDVQVSANQYEFDIYVKQTGATPMEAYGLQHCLIFDNAVLNGGTPTFAYIPGTSQMNASQEPTNATNVATVFSGKRVIKMAAKIPAGPGSGTVISSTGNGTRFGRFRLTTSAAEFSALQANFAVNFVQAGYGYATKYQAYVAGLPTDITVQANHFSSDLSNPVLPVELNSFTASASGRDVNISWETKTEVNSSKFEVERTAVNTQNWVKVGEVTASGNSNSAKEYSFTDKKLNSGKYSYRLKMVDNDGTYEYSKVVETEVSLPKEYAISQNYPNPFNPSTRIDYQLPFDSKVSLDIYGITGEKVATILNGDVAAGYYTTEINAGALNLASGVYIYRISATGSNNQNFVQVKKLMLTK